MTSEEEPLPDEFLDRVLGGDKSSTAASCGLELLHGERDSVFAFEVEPLDQIGVLANDEDFVGNGSAELPNGPSSLERFQELLGIAPRVDSRELVDDLPTQREVEVDLDFAR